MAQTFAAALLLLACFVYLIYQHMRRGRAPISPQEKQTTSTQQDPYSDIEPLPDFDLDNTPPIRNATFKPKYHLTMALENITLSDIVAMDNTYAKRMQIRRQIMDEEGPATIMCNPACEAAVLELYQWIFGTYLPKRFPTMYKLCPSEGEKSWNYLHNLISDEKIPTHTTEPLHALHTLGAHVDTDFLLLLPSSTSPAPDSQPIYHLQAFICCFPSGFSLRQKIGLPLAAIHTPVPGYKQKLEKSMDRFFAKLAVGKAVKRSNWAITTNGKLFSEGGNHLYDEDDDAAGHAHAAEQSSAPAAPPPPQGNAGAQKIDLTAHISQQKSLVSIPMCRLRSERQTLFRLPRSGAMVFSFKTYEYPLEEVKREGYGAELAQAIEGLGSGSVPAMARYKREVVWGERVREFLRS